MKKHLFSLVLIAILFSACKDSDCPEPTNTTPEKEAGTWTLTKWEILNGAFYEDDVFQYNFTSNSDTIDRDELSLRDDGTYIFDVSFKGDYIVPGVAPQRLIGSMLEVGSYQKVSSGTTGSIQFNSSSGTQQTMNILNETATELIIGLYTDESFDQGMVTFRQTGNIQYTFKK